MFLIATLTILLAGLVPLGLRNTAISVDDTRLSDNGMTNNLIKHIRGYAALGKNKTNSEGQDIE